MQTAKARPGSLEVPKKTSPAKPQIARKMRTAGSDSDAVSSPNPASKTLKDRSPKVVVRRSPRSPAIEMKRSTRASELETQLTQLQDELKRAKDQLNSSESWKRRAQQEADDAKKHLAAMSAKLEETEKQFQELSDNEDSRVLELRKISHDRDREWQSELEAVQKQHSMDSAALISAMNEIQRLKRMSESQVAQARYAESAHMEIQNLRVELTRTLALVEKLKSQVTESKESEARALEEVSKAQIQLEAAKMSEESLRAEGLKTREEYKSLAFELEQSKNHVSFLEGLVSKIQIDRENLADSSSNIVRETEEREELKAELDKVNLEVSQLRAALEAAERRYQEEYIQSTSQIRSAYELVEHEKAESCQREAELVAKFEAARVDVENLKEKVMDSETKMRKLSEENKGLNETVSTGREHLEIELMKSKSVLAELNGSLLDKETELLYITNENETLKSEIKKRDIKGDELKDEAEHEASMKLQHLTEEADKSSENAARVSEQLGAAQAANSELEAELRRLKVQADQWRKAAEAATALLSTGENGNYLDYHTLGGKLASSYSEDYTDDELLKKKNGNMLKKIGVLLKKGQK